MLQAALLAEQRDREHAFGELEFWSGLGYTINKPGLCHGSYHTAYYMEALVLYSAPTLTTMLIRWPAPPHATGKQSGPPLSKRYADSAQTSGSAMPLGYGQSRRVCEEAYCRHLLQSADTLSVDFDLKV